MAHHFLSGFFSSKCAVVVEWQTRYLEGVVGLCPWRFESSLPHHIDYDPRLFRRGFYFGENDYGDNSVIIRAYCMHSGGWGKE